MKRFVIALFAVLLGTGIFAQAAQAARLGSGKSFGMNRSSPMMQRDARPPQNVAPPPATATPAPAAPAPRSGMWGMLGGLALGAGLGALLGHLGFGGMGGGLLTMLLLVGGVILLFRLLASRMPQAQPVPNIPQPTRFEPAAATSGTAVPHASSGTAPAGFDTEGFLRQAKLNFVRLQAANDAGNMDDIKAFTTPEVYAETQMQYQERGKVRQQTDIVQLDAALLELNSENERQIASVRYSGLIRENPDAAPISFDEIWHLVRPEDGSSGWVVAGIQQFA